MEIKCKNCLLISICRNKPYLKLFNECQIISNYLKFYGVACTSRNKKLLNIYRVLKPSAWHIISMTEPVYKYGTELEENIGENLVYIVNEKIGKGWKYSGVERVE